MARPRSDQKREAIIAAAVRVIAAQGLGAPTAAIAREAGVSNGSLFNYFATKADLLNQLYRELKAEMGAAAADGLPAGDDVREQLRHIWTRWLRWATASPGKRRALAHLDVSGDVPPDSRRVAGEAMAGIGEVLGRSYRDGPLRSASPAFAVALMSALADTTIDFMVREPDRAEAHASTAFDTLWRMIA